MAQPLQDFDDDASESDAARSSTPGDKARRAGLRQATVATRNAARAARRTLRFVPWFVGAAAIALLTSVASAVYLVVANLMHTPAAQP